jgi:hypothetical protein
MDRVDWHRLFGLLVSDFFTNSPFIVELEKDLSLKKQFLDVVILRKRPGQFAGRLPDGFGNLATYNLITFKSHREALDDWALKELTGHYVNYRKQISPSFDNLLPEDDFKLYAVCSRFPQNLASSVVLQRIQDGVYECRRGTDRIHVLVAGELPQTDNNALLHLLSASAEQVRYGAAHYQQHSADTNSLLGRLLEGYQREGVAMSYTIEDFRRDYTKDHLNFLTPKERLEGLAPEDILKVISPEDILKAMSADEIRDLLEHAKQKAAPRKRKKKK